MSRPQDRRHEPRTTADGALVRVVVSAPVHVLDLSQSGVLMAAPVPIEPRQRASLRMAAGAEVLAADVEVRRLTLRRGDPGPTCCRLGAKFVALHESVRARLQQLLTAISSPLGGRTLGSGSSNDRVEG